MQFLAVIDTTNAQQHRLKDMNQVWLEIQELLPHRAAGKGQPELAIQRERDGGHWNHPGAKDFFGTAAGSEDHHFVAASPQTLDCFSKHRYDAVDLGQERLRHYSNLQFLGVTSVGL